MSRTVRSPDGRIWRIDRARPESPLGLTRKEPFFWSSVIATVFLIAFAARMVWADPGPLTLSIVVPLLTWRTTRRLWLGRIENRIAKEIETGRTESEPPGAVLIGI